MALKIKFDITRAKYQETKDSIASKMDEMLLDEVVIMTENKDPNRSEARKQPNPSFMEYIVETKTRMVGTIDNVSLYGTWDLEETAKVEEVVQESSFSTNVEIIKERHRTGQLVVVCSFCGSISCPNTYTQNCEIAGLQP